MSLICNPTELWYILLSTVCSNRYILYIIYNINDWKQKKKNKFTKMKNV